MLFESANMRLMADDQIATLWLDCAGRRDNMLTAAVLVELDMAISHVEASAGLDILVIRSAKPLQFAGGYDLGELSAFGTSGEFTAFSERGQGVLSRLEQLGTRLDTVALIEGSCAGAGLELALACRRRVAVGRPATVFSLPQVAQGLIPCWGGTARLPQLIGVKQAIRLLLGADAGVYRAERLGLVDIVLDEAQARIDFQSILDRLQDGYSLRRSLRSRWRVIRELIPFVRLSAVQRARRRIADVPKDECPAPGEALRAVRASLSSSASAQARERSALGRLGLTGTFRELTRQSRVAMQSARVYPEPINPVQLLPKRIGVVGGGWLGSRIAAWLAVHGCEVALREANEGSLEAANRNVESALQSHVRGGSIAPGEAERAARSIRRTTAWNGFESAGWVIESVEEDLGVKREVFHALEREVRPRTLLTSASSSLRIEAIQAELLRPGRIAGVHFPAGPDDVPLVEVVRAPATDPDTLAALDAWLRSLGKVPIIVSDRPGHVVHRLEMSYLSEAVLLVAEGLPPEWIDRAMRRFGMTRGPLEAVDTLGFDPLAQRTTDLQLARGDRFARNLLLERMRSLGWGGRTTSEGFYRYRGRKRRPNHLARVVMWQDLDDDAIGHYVFDPDETLRVGVERLVMRTVNEAAASLSEEPDADPGTIDLAATWGFGWAPHRGGPLRYADRIGLTAIVERLTEFAEQFGARFEPCLELQRRAEAGETFYGGAGTEEVLPLPEPRRLAG